MDPSKGGYGNGILKFPLDLSKVEDYFIPANGVFLDNVSSQTLPTIEPMQRQLSPVMHGLMQFSSPSRQPLSQHSQSIICALCIL